MPAWRFSTRRAAWKGVGQLCEQIFSFLGNKTSAVERSSHAPSRASGRLSRGAAHFFVARRVGRMEQRNATIKRRPVWNMLVDRPGLSEIYCHNGDDQNSRRPRSLLWDGWKAGWKARARRLQMASCSICATVNITARCRQRN